MQPDSFSQFVIHDQLGLRVSADELDGTRPAFVAFKEREWSGMATVVSFDGGRGGGASFESLELSRSVLIDRSLFLGR